MTLQLVRAQLLSQESATSSTIPTARTKAIITTIFMPTAPPRFGNYSQPDGSILFTSYQDTKSVASPLIREQHTVNLIDREPPTSPHDLDLSHAQLCKLHRYLSHVVGFPMTLKEISKFVDVRQGHRQHWKTYQEEFAKRRHRCFGKDDFPVLESYMRRAYPPESRILLWHRRIDDAVSWWLQSEESAGGGNHDMCRHDGGTTHCHGDREGSFS